LILCSAFGSNEVCAFDLYTGEVRESYKVQNFLKNQNQLNFVADMKSKDIRPALSLPTLFPYFSKDYSFQTFPNDLISVSNELSTTTKDMPHMSGVLFQEKDFILTAGSDAVIRYWNLQVEKEDSRHSRRISSADVDGRVFFKSHVENNASVIEEIVTKDALDQVNSSLIENDEEKYQLSGSASLGKLSFHLNSNKNKKAIRQRGPIEPPTYHTDNITDLKAFEFPQKMLISSSRNGKIKVWV
jgi:WD40 repeat protein